MSKSQHTPGPWEYRYFADCVQPHTVMGPKSSDGTQTSIAHTPWMNANVVANFRLIAAAPELLAACEAALLFHRGGDWGEIKHLWPEGVDATSKGLCDYIRAAIAKAKGGAS